jgi:hypothetical protein
VIHYGTRSQAVLAELAPELAQVFRDYAVEAPPDLDLTLIDGFRTGAEQQAAKDAGFSTKGPGQSKHDVRPARACDFNVYPALPSGAPLRVICAEYGLRAGFLLCLAARRGVELRWGGLWSNPFDPYHIELV